MDGRVHPPDVQPLDALLHPLDVQPLDGRLRLPDVAHLHVRFQAKLGDFSCISLQGEDERREMLPSCLTEPVEASLTLISLLPASTCLLTLLTFGLHFDHRD